MSSEGDGPQVIELQDVDDSRVADYSRLTDAALRRRRDAAGSGYGTYLAESSQVVRRALAAGDRPRSFFLAHRYLNSMADVFARYPDVPVYTGTDAMLERITGFHLHRGALAAMRRPAPRSVDEVIAGARRVAVVEDLVDHTNLGAIFRSAAALGVGAVLISPGSADPLYRRCIRVSMGAVFQVPWARFPDGEAPDGEAPDGEAPDGEAPDGGETVAPDGGWPAALERLRAAGFTLAALELTDSARPLDDAALRTVDRLALVLGSEGPGVRAETLRRCDVHVAIPMAARVSSLNVATASAVAFWELRARPV